MNLMWKDNHAKKKGAETAKKIFGANRGPNGNAQTTLLYDRTWFDTHCMDILGSDDLFSPRALPIKSPARHVQMVMRGTTVY